MPNRLPNADQARIDPRKLLVALAPDQLRKLAPTDVLTTRQLPLAV